MPDIEQGARTLSFFQIHLEIDDSENLAVLAASPMRQIAFAFAAFFQKPSQQIDLFERIRSTPPTPISGGGPFPPKDNCRR